MPEQSDEVSNVRDCMRDQRRFLGFLSDMYKALTEQPTASSDYGHIQQRHYLLKKARCKIDRVSFIKRKLSTRMTTKDGRSLGKRLDEANAHSNVLLD